ncbi:MAG: Curculin domain protein (mannose-binding) lectin [Conexibacter sp.]|nr:Curculin domain protein (mannose-binding) lectin [Conexibacter sp.]
MRRATIAALTTLALLLASGAASAKTWNITPTTINETSGQIIPWTGGNSSGGNFVTQPDYRTPMGFGNEPGDNGNQFTWLLTAPDLFEGADAFVNYIMPDNSQFDTVVQDDYNRTPGQTVSSPTCVLRDPSTTLSDYSCAATLGYTGGPPQNPSNGGYTPSPSSFSPFFNFRDNSSGAPGGSRMASVAAAGQSCNDYFSPGDTLDCTVGQPSMAGFSPVDPNNFETLYLINRGSTPVTVTDRSPTIEQLINDHPGGCFIPDYFNGSECQQYKPNTCTMSAWGGECTILTWGGANGHWDYQYGHTIAYAQTQSDDISITPGPGAPSGDAWYGVMIYGQSEIGQEPLVAQDFATILAGFADDYLTFVNSWSYSTDNGDDDDEVTIDSGNGLRSGASVQKGPFTLAMQRSGNLVERVSVNHARYPVWSSATSSPGARLVVSGAGNLAVQSKSGRSLWSSHTSGSPGARLSLQGDGNVVLRARSHRALFTTGSVSYSYPADPTATALDKDLGLLPRAALRRGGSRLVMRPNGNLALYRHGTAVWSTKTVGHPGAYAHMRKDGRLVVSDPHGRTLWSSSTYGRLAKLSLRSDGTLEIAGHKHRTVWTPKRASRPTAH